MSEAEPCRFATGEPGSQVLRLLRIRGAKDLVTCDDKTQNLPCGRFCAFVRGGALFLQQKKWRAGIAEFYERRRVKYPLWQRLIQLVKAALCFSTWATANVLCLYIPKTPSVG